MTLLARVSSTTLLARLGEAANRTFVLPIVIFFPTSRCNSRCVSCDWWKSSGADDLSLNEIDSLAIDLTKLGTRLVAFSGGEPLLRPDVFSAARSFRSRGMTLHLLTSGVLLDRFVKEVAQEFSRVIVSLDAASEQLYHDIRGVSALRVLEAGVARLKRLAPQVKITARATLHRMNFRELPRLIEHAHRMALDGISFLAADLSSSAFGRERNGQTAALALTSDEILEFEHVIERTIATEARAFTSGFVAESPEKLRRLAGYYRALAGMGRFPSITCNAPYVSVVVEADGSVRPCFFQPAVGTIRKTALDTIVRRNLPAFRRSLDMSTDTICERCVCSLKTHLRPAPWL